MKVAVVYILISVLTSTVGQLMLKQGMVNMGEVTLSMDQLWRTVWRMGTNPYVFFGLAIYLVGTVYWLAALSRVDLSFAYPFASISYVIMLITSWALFHEQITLNRALGTLVIGVGVLLVFRN